MREHTLIAIDGACYHSGKEDSMGCGAMVVFNESDNIANTKLISDHNCVAGITSQAAEIEGLIMALDYSIKHHVDGAIITDSEYIFHTLSMRWLYSWAANGWLTSLGEPVKNKDRWLQVLNKCEQLDDDVGISHVKGHVISIGEVTAAGLMSNDSSGTDVFRWLTRRLGQLRGQEKFEARYKHAQEVFEKNHGCPPPQTILDMSIVLNSTVDKVATYFLKEERRKS